MPGLFRRIKNSARPESFNLLARRRFFPQYPRVFYAATISVSFDRAKMAAFLGGAANFSRLEPRRFHSAGTSVRQAARPAGEGPGGTASAQVLYSRHVPLSLRGGPACGPSGRIHRHRYSGALSPRPGFQCAASDGLGRLWTAGRAIRHPHGTASAEND